MSVDSPGLTNAWSGSVVSSFNQGAGVLPPTISTDRFGNSVSTITGDGCVPGRYRIDIAQTTSPFTRFFATFVIQNP